MVVSVYLTPERGVVRTVCDKCTSIHLPRSFVTLVGNNTGGFLYVGRLTGDFVARRLWEISVLSIPSGTSGPGIGVRTEREK